MNNDYDDSGCDDDHYDDTDSKRMVPVIIMRIRWRRG